MSKLKMPAAVAAGLLLAMSGGAWAQDATPSGPPPSWDVLVRCAKIADDDASLACFREAMRSAGYAPNPQEVTAERHRRFGLSMPQIGILKHKSRQEGQEAVASSAGAAPQTPTLTPAAQGGAVVEEDDNQITVQLDEIALIPPENRLLMITSDGGVWEQSYAEQVSPLPKVGQSMVIKKNRLGGYMCVFNKHQGVHCTRKR